MLSQTPHDAFPAQKPYNALSSSHNKLDFKNSVKPLKNEEGASSSHDAYYCAPLLLPRHFLLHIEKSTTSSKPGCLFIIRKNIESSVACSLNLDMTLPPPQ